MCPVSAPIFRFLTIHHQNVSNTQDKYMINIPLSSQRSTRLTSNRLDSALSGKNVLYIPLVQTSEKACQI